MLSLALAAAIGIPALNVADLYDGFKKPPQSAQPHTWWHWMDGNVTREGITADLEAMKQAGIAGAHIFDVGQGVPAGPIAYNSPEWRALMVHALREAKRLGLEMTMHNCAGWSSSGGPWVQPKDAMKKLAFAATKFSGSGAPTGPITLPQKVGEYFEDIAIFAIRTDSNPGAELLGRLTGLDANPGQIKNLSWPRIAPEDIIPIPLEKLSPQHRIDVDLPQGDYVILRVAATLTGSQNVASRDSGRGLEVDKLSAESLDNFLAGGLDPLLDQVGDDSSLSTVLVDSYETGYNNWSPNLFAEFAKRRGYEVGPYLPALAGYIVKDQATTLGFLFDYRRTIAELWAENYSVHFAQRLKERDLQLAIEPYGNGNFDPFTFAKPAGLIMGEYWVGDTVINPAVKHAASVAHVYGHSVVGAEALTAMPTMAGWRNQPRQWKPFADHAMTLGINRIIYHRFAHQPWVDGVLPGMTMGPWGSHVDRGNTFWSYMPTWNEYLARCQFMLQQGHFVGDILLFAGEDSPQSYAGEGQILPPIPSGYDFDYIGLDPLMSLQVKSGRLVLPNGASYAVLALPNSDAMTLPMARKVRDLVMAGATVIGPKPVRTPSLSEARDGAGLEVARIGEAVWGSDISRAGSRQVGKGRVVWGRTIAQVLTEAKVAPAFVTKERDVRAIQRRAGANDFFFVASSQPYPRTVTCRFRVDGKPTRIQLWHPETGAIEHGVTWKAVAGGIEMPIRLEADGSVFVWIAKGDKPSDHLVETQAVLAAERAKPKPRLTILKAIYGDAASGKVTDVTKIVAGAADAHTVRIGATNTAMGGDPAYNVIKTLTVTYKLGDDTKTVTLRENEVLAIGDLPDPGTPPAYLANHGALEVWQNGEFTVLKSNGSRKKYVVKDLPAPIPVEGPWQASFPAGWDAPPRVTFDKLTSWTDHDDFGVKHFSGTVTYTRKLAVPDSITGNGQRVVLDLGDVRELCRVRLNGKLVATLWKPPFRIDITDSVRSGQNDLEVEVTNLWVNRLIGDEQFPDDMGWNGAMLAGWPKWFSEKSARPEPRRKTFTTWRHNFKDTPLLPSGLLGPVVLRPVRIIRP
ncbi:MAG: hypothetical protein HONBIEJF_01894 [Fimbriimonadaceae bacterium]|nr:hypothetical protein [Fimbriimonadaceae bacterium]